MKKLTLLIIIIFISTLMVVPAHSGLKKIAQTGLQFLKIDMSPRAAAMGSAFNNITGDASAIFYNTAGMAEIESSIDVFAAQTQWIADITYNAGAVVKNMGNWGNFGLSVQFADYGTIEGTVVDQTLEAGYRTTGDVDVSAYAVGLSYARRLSAQFMIGGTVKFVSQNLGKTEMEDGVQENSVDGLAYDFGTVFYPGFKSFRFGMSIRNYSGSFSYDASEQSDFTLPLTFTFGVAMNVLDLLEEQEQHSVVVAIDAIHPRDYSERIHLGAEYWFQNMFAVRAGYKTNYDIEGLTAGLGINYDLSGVKLKIDYSYSEMEVFDAVNRFSVGIGF